MPVPGFLPEMVRRLADEASLIDDATVYSKAAGGWGTLHNYGNITLAENTLVVFSFYAPVSWYQGWRLKVGSYYVWGENVPQAGTTYHGIAFVSAGTHAVVAESRDSTAEQQISNFKLGKAEFNDQVGSALAAYAGQIALTVSSRKTPLGDLRNAVFAVYVWAYTPGEDTNLENVGDALTNGVSLMVDGVQVNWTKREQDPDSLENCHGHYYGSVTVGSQHTFAISKDNANTVVHVSIVGCPWLLAAVDNEPFSLDFTQGSTVYLTLEPLDSNPTKNVRIGKKRAVSFGDNTDFYSTGSGSGLLSHSFTFESVEVSGCLLAVNGQGGCISIFAVDLR